jgi:hypothetical protein
MRAHRPLTRLGLGLLVLSTATNTVGQYAAAHPRGGHQHFDTCRVLPDGTLILDYTYGAGDKVTASVDPTGSPIVVSLHLDRIAGGLVPAIALHGQLRVDSFGGLRGRPVSHRDGTTILCRFGAAYSHETSLHAATFWGHRQVPAPITPP